MELVDVFAQIAELPEPPPAPPDCIAPEVTTPRRLAPSGRGVFRENLRGVQTGSDLWSQLVPSTLEPHRAAPIVSRKAWEALLTQEKIRRGREQWAVDHFPDGRLRPDDERAEIRRLDFAVCKGDFWRWLHRRG